MDLDARKGPSARAQSANRTQWDDGSTCGQRDRHDHVRREGERRHPDRRTRHATTFTYDSGGNLTTVTDALGRTTTLAYDPEDRRKTVTAPLSGGTTRTATLTYDGEGQVVAAADFLNRVTTSAYNSRGGAAVVTDPLGHAVTYLYTNTGMLSTKGSSRGVPVGVGTDTESYSYDALDRLVTMGDPLGRVVTTVYDAVGNVTAVQKPLSRTTTYAYDARDRATTITDALSHNTVIAYDSGGNRTSVTDALSHAGNERVSEDHLGAK